MFGSRALQNAIADGETRTISMHHIHTNENITITFKRDGRYDDAALDKLNWFLRDWRRSEQTRMDPHLIDLIWEVERETGTKQPVEVVCGYRSPATNAMLRRRSKGVARFSQHMLGHAMDFYIPGVPLAELRVIGLRLQRGGVGFYPESGSPFVHMDTGGIRMWPRMTHDELSRVFPDGRTVLIPTDGRPLSGYALALADIRKRGSDPSMNSIEAARNAGVDVGSEVASNNGVNLFAKLLGLAKEDDDEDADTAAPQVVASAAPAPATHLKPLGLAKIDRSAGKTAPPRLLHAAVAMVQTDAPRPPAPVRSGGGNVASAASTPNQVITARGYWEGLPDGTSATPPAAKNPDAQDIGLRTRPQQIASADPVTTASLSPWSNTATDRVPADLALAYAEQPGQVTPYPAAPVAARTADDQAGHLIAESGMTIATKGLIDRPKTIYQKAKRIAAAALKVATRMDDPWLRAIVVSPSVQRFLTTLALGTRDFTALATLMVKPTSSVMMTFSSDPNLGLTPDHFSGSAIVFVSTVTYPTHTASLQ